MKKLKGVFVCLALASMLASCASSPVVTEPPAGTESYYVRADGNDRNAGTSEDAPFKTLARALEVASNSNVKKITVIGTLIGSTSTEHLRAILFQGIDENTKHPSEILITGKPNASAAEKAILTSNAEHRALDIMNAAIRLEHIEISGCQGGAVSVMMGLLTLAEGAKITNNKGDRNVGILSYASSVIIRDNAEVSHNEGEYNAGIFLYNGSTVLLRDNALISNNRATYNGGGIAVSTSTLLIKDNAMITNNSAGDFGGGIMAYGEEEDDKSSQIVITDNANIARNSAQAGGGIFLNNNTVLAIFMSTVRITENTASFGLGGVGRTAGASVSGHIDSTIVNNQAPQIPDIGIYGN